MQALSARYDAALQLAAIAHRHQVRKATHIPYITHPVHVSIILLRHGFHEELAIAGLLHDVVEDCDMTIAELQAEFGEVVARLVEAVSEQKQAAGVERSWEARKAEKLAHMRNGDADVAALKAADALHNAWSIRHDLAELGPVVWQRFKRGAAPSVGYYREIAAIAREKLGAHTLVVELEAMVASLAQAAQLPPESPE
ncbi:MAG TPA: HD domain-containing protein [Roseiflexaceae bacterium]|nr:HD domain-containing protein [Roseiflexaceae bacterium]HMP42763.1 HD domain-containing protein [Roseiflexaceae bacterium]